MGIWDIGNPDLNNPRGKKEGDFRKKTPVTNRGFTSYIPTSDTVIVPGGPPVDIAGRPAGTTFPTPQHVLNPANPESGINNSPYAAVKAPITNNGAGGRGGSLSDNSGTKNLIDTLYDSIMGNVTGIQARGQGDFDATKATISKQYDNSMLDLYKQYQNSRDTLAGNAANLGVDYDNSKMGQNWDVALRALQETGDLAKTSDLSWLDKMKLLNNDMYNQVLSGLAQDKILAASGGSSGGGGSYRGSGGSGGSGKTTSTAKETQTMYNVGDTEIMGELARTNPAAAALLQAAYYGSSLDPDSTVSTLQDKIGATGNVKLPSYIQKKMPKFTASAKKAQGKVVNNLTAAQLAALKLTGKMGNPKVGQTVTSSGKVTS